MFISLRPNLEEFLEEISEYYEIFLYSHGTEDYVKAILDVIDPSL